MAAQKLVLNCRRIVLYLKWGKFVRSSHSDESQCRNALIHKTKLEGAILMSFPPQIKLIFATLSHTFPDSCTLEEDNEGRWDLELLCFGVLD